MRRDARGRFAKEPYIIPVGGVNEVPVRSRLVQMWLMGMNIRPDVPVLLKFHFEDVAPPKRPWWKLWLK